LEKTSREEHVEWCKKRALEYVDMGKLSQAFNSIMSDLQKHPETRGHSGIEVGFMLLFGNFLSTEKEMRDFIEGFK